MLHSASSSLLLSCLSRFKWILIECLDYASISSMLPMSDQWGRFSSIWLRSVGSSKMRYKHFSIFLLFGIITVLLSGHLNTALAKICDEKSIHGKVTSLNKLKDCSVIEGRLVISLMHNGECSFRPVFAVRTRSPHDPRNTRFGILKFRC